MSTNKHLGSLKSKPSLTFPIESICVPCEFQIRRDHRDVNHRFTRRSNTFDPFSPDLCDPFDASPFNHSLFSFTRPSTSLSFPSDTSTLAAARIDWKETPKAHVFTADLPGMKKEEVEVEVEEGNILQISGEHTRENEEKTDTWYRVEHSNEKFLRRFRLPENVKMDQMKAAMDNGVLTVTVPKEKVKSIKIYG
ncbi:18.1 kDa class I heat shock protein-like [Carex rostrata]